jgi:hypothetical protein
MLCDCASSAGTPARMEVPRVYLTDHGTYVVQGYKVLDVEALSQLTVPDHETCVEIPPSLLKYFLKD